MMTEENTSIAGKTREIVEKILARLYVDGSIKDDHLSKKVLQKVTSNFIIQNNIKDFSYEDMCGAMLKFNFCYYMKRELAHRCSYFHVNTSKIAQLAEKYAGAAEVSQEESPNDKEMIAPHFEYVLTIKQEDEGDFSFSESSDKSCFVCKETFVLYQEYEDHMKSHGKDFEIPVINCWPQVINLTADFHEEEEKFVCKILLENDAKILIDKVFLILPEDNDFHPLETYEEENCIKFDIHCGILFILRYSYSILIFYKLECKTSLLTQFHFKVNDEFSDKNDTDELDEPIKERRCYTLPQHVKRTFFDRLPSYEPSDEMKKLTQKNFTIINSTEEEERLLAKINDFLLKDVTQSNYVEFWTTFVEIEDCAVEKQFAMIAKLGVKLIYKEGYYLLKIPNLSEQTPTITEGGDVIVSISSPSSQFSKSMIARVYQVRKKDVVLQFEEENYLEKNTLYDVKFLPNRVTIQIEREALSYVAKQKISKLFFPDTIPTHSIDFDGFEWINESVKSNPEQQIAIMHIVGKSSFPAPYILMGPPGTGKTTTIVEAVCQIIKRDPEARILVAAGSNYAANVIALRLLRYLPETSVYRMFASSKEAEADSMNDQLKKISNLKFDSHYYPGLDELYSYNVVLTTLAVAGKFAQAKIKREHFSYVFVDEAGSSTEPSTLIPIAGVISSPRQIHGQIILAGDPMQLGPIVASDMARDSLGVSLLERLVDTGIYKKDPVTGKYNPRVITKLIRNFRSHPKILEFSDEEFYSGELMAEGRPEITRWACNWRYLPNRSIPIIFEHVIGNSAQDDNSPSWYNMQEVRRVMFHIDHLIRAKNINGKKITQDCIGVISPYKKQCQKIAIECKKRNLIDIEVGSVEKFQGHEKPVIILSTVRSLTRSVGFLNNPKRLNVALTRAQALLIIVGNVDTLETDDTWGGLIAFCRSNNLIKEVTSANQDAPPQRRSRSQSANRKIQPKKSVNKENIKSSPTKTVEPPRTHSGGILNLPDVPKNDTIRQSSVSDISGVDVHTISTPRETHERPLYPRQPQFAMPLRNPPLDTYSRFEMVNRLHSGGPRGVLLDERCGTGRYAYSQKDLTSTSSGAQGLGSVKPRDQDLEGSYVFLEEPLPHLGETPRPRKSTTFQQNPPKPEKKKEKKCLIM